MTKFVKTPTIPNITEISSKIWQINSPKDMFGDVMYAPLISHFTQTFKSRREQSIPDSGKSLATHWKYSKPTIILVKFLVDNKFWLIVLTEFIFKSDQALALDRA